MQKKNGTSEHPSGARKHSVKTMVGVPTLPAQPAPEVEELSGSLLVEEPSDGFPPAAERLAQRRLQLPVMASAGLVLGIGLALLVVAARRRHPNAAHSAVMTGSASGSPRAFAPAPLGPEGPSTATPGACTTVGLPQVIAPSALVSVGIEVRAFGNEIALGFAPNEHEATLVRLEPSSLSTLETSTARSALPIRRVTPVPGKKGRLGLAIDADREGDPLEERRTLPLDPPIQVGVAGGYLAWALQGQGIQGKLWPLEGSAAVDALRGGRSDSNLAMVGIAFRRGGLVWVGTAERTTTLAPKGALSRIEGLGPSVGSPAIAVNDGVVIAAWADRVSSEDPWQLRYVRFRAGEPAGEPNRFTPPPGGKGQDVMSPALAVVPAERFLLVWTEGPASAHEVRATTLSIDGPPFGPPLRISSENVNAGQGQAAVTANGKGVVAYLESSDARFRVVATRIACAP